MDSGTRIGPYEIALSLGVGGMGEVFQARDTRLHRDVAVKVLPRDFVADADRVRRFEQEAKALAALNHPNILTVHDAGVHDGAPYLVSELLVGRTMRDEMVGGALPLSKVVDYALQIAHGIAAAHAKGVIHRDLKPENLFITQDGRVKILDFGLAKLRPPVPGMPPVGGVVTPQTAGTTLRIDAHAVVNTTQPGMVLGTPAYMAPEQVRGERADHRADIFALGCVLYEMLSGRSAFRRDTAVASMNAVLSDTPPNLSATNPSIPPALERIIERCLEKRPEQRFQSVSDLAFGLKEWSSQPSSDVRRRSNTGRTSKYVGAALCGVVLVISIAWWLTHRRDRSSGLAKGLTLPARIASIAVLPLENLSHDADQEFFSDGMTDELITELQKIGAWKVISRTTMMRYKKNTKSLPEIARELNVDGIVEGTVLRDGQKVRISTKLMHGQSEQQLWGESYLRDARDVLSLQSDVALAIARAIKIKLTPEEQARLSRLRPVNPAALEAYFKGRQQWLYFTPSSFQASIDYCNQAIQLDPTYAAAYAQLGACYNASANMELMWPRDAFTKAKQYMDKSLELEENDVARLHLAAIQQFYDWDWEGAEQNIKRALQLNRNEGLYHASYAAWLNLRGRFDEALAEARLAVSLEPYSPPVMVTLGQVFSKRREFGQAITEFQKATNAVPDSIILQNELGRALIASGRYDEATTMLRAALGPRRDRMVSAVLGVALARSGQKTAAEQILKDLHERRQEAEKTREFYVSPYNLALVHAGLGENAQALDWLEKGFEERIFWMTILKADPLLDSLREEPRFQELVRKMNFPQ